MIWIFLVAFALFSGVHAVYESIGDITNNLASDLAPLITLFGEQATKQFLSESTSFKDSIIFSIAPLGLITAVVSVIRIYGSSSFKSIIGRSQEAHGVAEAELCSSTSQDVCELWSNGGICRVFGRPKILDFIYNNTVNNDFYSKYRKDQHQHIVEEGPSCGIYRPNTLFVSGDEEMRKKMELFGWEEVFPNRWKWAKVLSRPVKEPKDNSTQDKPSANPNLTLNIGIRKVHQGIHWSVLIFSVLLQLSFFAYATWATFYDLSFLTEGTQSPQAEVWFGMTILGTTMLVSGMILCARLIDLKSRERRFKRIGGTSKIFWLQPGGQRIGDQLFQAFAYSESGDEYIMSGRVDDTKRQRTLLLAVISTTSGWVLQFVGLRGSPGSIALFQFIATLTMSFLRAILRGKRLEANKNRLEHDDYKNNNLIEGHELDWQAMNIDGDDQKYAPGWRVSDHFPNEDQDNVTEETHKGVTAISSRRFQAYYTKNDDCITHAANYASEWIAEQEAIKPSSASKGGQDALPSQRKQSDSSCSTSINPAAKIMRFRSRLAKLTTVQFGLPPEQAWDGEIRTTALQLQQALQVSAEYIFAQFPLDPAWNGNSAPKSIAWKSSCLFSKLPRRTPQESDVPENGQQGVGDLLTIGFQMNNRDGKWSINSHQLESVLGLWSWSLKRSELLHPTAEELLTRSKLIVVEKSKRDDIEAALYHWVTQTRKVREYGALGGISRSDNLSIPLSSLLNNAASSMQSSGTLGQTYTPSTDGLTILGIPTNGSTSLLQLMAQDVYTVFINRIVDIVETLSGTGDPEDYLTRREDPLSIAPRAAPLLELTNPHIDALAHALVSAGFATREEALMSIVPVFLRQMKLPLPDEDMAQNLLDWAKSLRRDLKFQEGAAAIIWMLSTYPARFHRQGLRCLGDLYRRAALSKDRGHQKFGLSGIRNMKKCHSALASDPQAQDILTCYEHLYDVFRDRGTSKASQESSDDKKHFYYYRDQLRKSSGNQGMQTAVTQEDLELALTFSVRFSLPNDNKLPEYIQLADILECAIHMNFPELIEDLWIKASWPLGSRGRKTLLLAFDHKCELETFHSLLDWPGLNINEGYGEYQPDNRPITPLVCAIEANRADVICSMLRRGAALHQRDHLGLTPLHHASDFSNTSVIQVLLQKGAGIHEKDEKGRTPLHFAAGANSKVVIQLLLESGAGVHEKDEYGRTPLHLAAQTNSKDVVQFLLENGAEVHEKDKRGQTTLHYAAANMEGEEAARLLLRKGADVNKEDIESETALHFAARLGHGEVLRLLLEKSAEDGLVDGHRWSSLWSIMPKDDEGMAQLLDEKGVEKPLDFQGIEGSEQQEEGEEGQEEEEEEGGG